MGWQRQDHGPSVQQTLEEALQRMTGEDGRFIAAGRTDAGVHALAMSAHVDVMKSLTPHRLREGLNALVRPQPDLGAGGRGCRRRLARALLVRRAALPLSHPQPAGARLRSMPAASGISRRRSMSKRWRRRGASHRTPRLHDLPLGAMPVGQPGEDARRAEVAQARRGNPRHRRGARASFITRCGRWSAAWRWLGVGNGSRTICARRLEARDRSALGFNAPPHGLYFVEAVYPEV